MSDELLLRVEAPRFTAGAVFHRIDGQWRCTKAAPIINWFQRVRHLEVIESWLWKNHCRFQWLYPLSSASTREAQTRQLDTPGGVTRDEQGTPTVATKPRWRRVAPAKARQSRVEKKHMTAGTVGTNHPQAAPVNGSPSPMREPRSPRSMTAASNAN